MFVPSRIPGALALATSLSLFTIVSTQASPAHGAHVTAAHASNEQVTAASLARVNARLTALTQAHKFSGTVLVAQGDTVLLRKGYGMADGIHQIHNTSATEFITHDLALEFAAVAVLQLEDAGKLHDNDRLCTYIPHCPATWSTITVRELLNRTSGIHDIVNNPTLGETVLQSYTLVQAADFAMQEPLEHRPGSELDSNVNGMTVVEKYLVERLSGESFGTYVQDHFLRPLGLRHTGYYLHAPKISQLAAGYQSRQDPATYYPAQYDMSLFGGSVYSTVDDVFRWEQAVNTGQILSAAATAKFMTSSFVFCHTPAGCGSGVTSQGTTEGLGIFTWHSHPITTMNCALPDIGFEDWTLYFTDAKVTLVVLMNQNESLQNASGVYSLLFS